MLSLILYEASPSFLKMSTNPMMRSYSKPLILLLALTNSACTPPSSVMEKSPIIQSQNDSRLYQSFTLDNGLKVLIISDTEAKKAAASLDVFVGSSSDPKDRAGLAHFLEHMLFLGTKRYPDPDEYQNFSAQHGGSRNAFTASEHTNYFFDIENASFEPMLDRFSQFFSAPLFNTEFVEREKNAVNSEYLGKIKTENRRFYAAMQQAFNPKSPYANFTVGSLETLADRDKKLTRDDLLKFYKTHYSANLMSLVVLANEPLPILKTWVTDKFSVIPNYHVEKKVFNEPWLTSQQMAHQIDIKSLQETRQLTLTFPLPAVQSHYLAKPSHYFQSLLGHESKGSILALLKEKGWADELSASSGFSNNAQESSVQIGINLTQAGLTHTNDIIEIVFQYIRLLQQSDIQPWLFQEHRQMSQLRFRYQEQQSASSTVTHLAQSLQYYPTQDVLRGSSIIEQFEPKLIKELIDLLTPEHVLISLNTQNLDTNKTEKNYQVDYRITAIEPMLLQRWGHSDINTALSLPSPNPFIPDQLSLKKESQQAIDSHPILIQQTAEIDLWHQLDTHFKVPRNNLYIAIHSPLTNHSPKQSLLTLLLAGVINKQLSSEAYPARLAGLNYSIYPTERGLTLSLSGYDQKQSVLLKRMAAALKTPEITEKRFNILTARYQQKLRNAQKQQPFQQILSDLKRTLTEHRWTNEQQLEALEKLTLKDLNTFSKKFLKQGHLTLLAQGNMTTDEAIHIANTIKQQLLPTDHVNVSVAASKTIQLPQKSLNVRQLSIDNHDAALALYFQAPNKTIQSQAEAQLLGRIISPAFFADLRTQQQLGYNLGAAALAVKDLPGIIFILQSPIISAPEIEQRIKQFIPSFQKTLENTPHKEFEAYKAGLITRLLEKDKNLHKKSNYNWSEINRENTHFDTRKKVAEAVKKIDQPRLLKIYQDWLIDQPRQFRTYALGNQFSHDDFSKQPIITNPQIFKEAHIKL